MFLLDFENVSIFFPLQLFIEVFLASGSCCGNRGSNIILGLAEGTGGPWKLPEFPFQGRSNTSHGWSYRPGSPAGGDWT